MDSERTKRFKDEPPSQSDMLADEEKVGASDPIGTLQSELALN
jgi:hypothetical protein